MVTAQVLEQRRKYAEPRQAQVSWQDVLRAHKEVVIAADLVEVAIMERMSRHVIEQRSQDMYAATRHYQDLNDLYYEQAVE